MTELPPISNKWMADGMEAVHELYPRMSRDLRKADLQQAEHYYTGCFGALIGSMMGKMGPEQARTMLTRLLKEIESGYQAEKALVN